MPAKRIKPEKKVKMGEVEYRRLRRREQQLLAVKNHIREAWRILKQVQK